MNPSPLQDPADLSATAVLDTIPMVMRAIRSELRKKSSPDLTVPQFRTLAFLGHRGETSLSHVAEHIGVTLPSASKLVDRLVSKRYACRKILSRDRRHIQLTLTTRGSHKLKEVRKEARDFIAVKLNSLTQADHLHLQQAMASLKTIFACNSSTCKSNRKS